MHSPQPILFLLLIFLFSVQKVGSCSPCTLSYRSFAAASLGREGGPDWQWMRVGTSHSGSFVLKRFEPPVFFLSCLAPQPRHQWPAWTFQGHYWERHIRLWTKARDAAKFLWQRHWQWVIWWWWFRNIFQECREITSRDEGGGVDAGLVSPLGLVTPGHNGFYGSDSGLSSSWAFSTCPDHVTSSCGETSV